MIKLGLYTGQRLSDLATITWSQVDLPRAEIRLQVRKTGRRLLLPIAAPLHEHLMGLAGADQAGAPIHPRAYAAVNHGRVSKLSAQFSKLLIAAGVVAAGQGKRALTFHSLRHTAVSLLKDAGVPDAVVMALVGHERVAMSARYTHIGGFRRCAKPQRVCRRFRLRPKSLQNRPVRAYLLADKQAAKAMKQWLAGWDQANLA